MIIKLIGKFSGFNKIWSAADGYKTKISGVALFLSGLSILLTQVVGLPQDLSAFVDFAKNLPNNNAWLTLISGLGILGIGHKIEKQEVKPEEKK